MQVVDRVVEFAKNKGIKQVYICTEIGVARNWFSIVKRDNIKISPERLAQIADILGTTVDYLNGETDDPSPVKEKGSSELDELLSDPLNKALFDKLSKLSSAKKKALLALIEDQESD